MKLSRQSRFAAAVLALFCVLFTQIAVAGYACPSMQIARAMESIAAPAVEAAHAAMPDCPGMSEEEPVACQDHGQVGSQSLDKPAAPDVSPFIAALLVQHLDHATITWQALTPLAENHALTRTTAPPLAIRNCCFRI